MKVLLIAALLAMPLPAAADRLTELLAAGRNHGRELAEAEAVAAQADATIALARAPLWPTLAIGAGYTRNQHASVVPIGGDNLTIVPLDQADVTATLTVPLFDLSTRRRVSAAAADHAAATAAIAVTARDGDRAIVRAYFAWVGAPLAATAALLLVACSGDDGESTVDAAPGGVPAVFTENYRSSVTLSADSVSVTLKSMGVPDHTTPYWDPSNPLHVDQREGGSVTPGYLMEQDLSMTIPVSPAEAATKEATSLGPVGMALNGVAIYNDREGGNVPVDAMVLLTMDVGGGHSGPGGLYHYHFEPSYLANDNNALIGHLRDGFPIYGRRDVAGSYPTDLDENGGHVGATAEYPDGIYHYHCSSVNYMNGGYYVMKAGAYHGTKGPFTN